MTSTEAKATNGRLALLMELRPCFDGYAGIPQETRLLFAALARDEGVRLGGLLDGGKRIGRLPPAASPDDSTAGKLFAQTQQIIALDALSSPETHGTASGRLSASALDLLSKRLGLLSRWGAEDDLQATIDPALFGDWIWTRLFQRGLPAGDRRHVWNAAFHVPRMTWQDAARLSIVSAKARPLLDLSKGPWNVFMAHTPSPYRVKGGAMIVRYHDAIPLLWPHTIGGATAQSRAHFAMLTRNVVEGAWFVCDSDTSRNDLLRFFPEAADRTTIIPVLFSTAPAPESSHGEPLEIASRYRMTPADEPAGTATGASTEPYVLAVSTLEPRKNYGLLMRAFALARRAGAKLKLVIVANPGWRSEAELAELRRLVGDGGAMHLADVPPRDLAVLYANAHAVICPSRMEGFDLATVEAMTHGAPVLASDIPVHRSVCGEAVEYFDPYDEDELGQLLLQIASLPRDEGRLAALAEGGRRQAQRYQPETIMAQWREVLLRIAGRS